MLIETYGNRFAADIAAVLPAVPAKTALGQTADEILEMTACYASDGMVFYRSGDPVNAVASFAYGYGWLDAGITLGFVTGHPISSPPEITDTPAAHLLDHLTEKTNHYQRMLSSACKSVVILPDTETRMHRATQNISTIAADSLGLGTGQLNAGDLVNALSSFSYGYGWLDCGVRAGLFGITGNRHLFTI